MRLITPAHLSERLRVDSARLDALATATADVVSALRLRIERHRVAIALAGGAVAGAMLATRRRALWRFAADTIGMIARVATVSAVNRVMAQRTRANRAT